MAKAKKEKPKEDEKVVKEKQLVLRAKSLFAHAKEHRRKYDWEWLIRNLFVRGYHFSRYNRRTGAVVFGTKTGVKIPINLVAAHLRGVRNQVTSFQPKWEVLPNVTTESAYENARYSGKVLDYLYKKSQIKRKIKEVVNHALIHSIGIWHFSTNKKGDIVINVIDPFDFYVDPNVKSPDINDPENGAEFIILTSQLPKDYVKNNPNYENTEQLEADNQVASAEYKRFLLQVTKRQENASEDNETILLHQAWMRERQEDGEMKMRVITYTEDIHRPLRNEVLDDPDYPFEILQGDIANSELYGESWVKHLIPINRVINSLEGHIFEYNHFFARGRFVIDKNSGVRIITNQHGQIIEKNRGATVSSLPIAPLPSSPQEQIDNMRRYLEDISGVHDVSLGRLPGTIRSGVAIAELKAADATNQNDLIDNLEDFLSRSGQRILKLVSENWTTTKLVSVTGLGGKAERFMAIGERGKISEEAKKKGKFTFGEMELPLATIGADNEVRVQIGSWLAYTKEARQEKLKELFRLGAIDQKTYLEHGEFADIDGIMERTRDEQLLQSRMDQTSEAAERDFGVKLDEESLAIAENELMSEGVNQPVYPDDDHELHMTIHKEQSDDELTKAHINEHAKYQRWLSSMRSRPMSEDVPPEEGGVPAPAGLAPEGIPAPMGGMPESGGIPGGIGEVPPELGGM